MTKQVIVLLLSTSLFSCKNPGEKQATVPTAETAESLAAVHECYESNKASDTVRLTIDVTGNDVSGHLEYLLSGKERNHGTITGKLMGDTLLANYVFESEGTVSSREVIFLKSDSSLAEGYGSSLERDGQVVFQDRSAIRFGSGIVLVKTACN